MFYLGGGLVVAGVVGGVLEETVHDVVTRGTEGFVESGGDGDVDEGVLGDSVVEGLFEGGFEGVEGLAVDVDCALEEGLGRCWVVFKTFEFGETLDGYIKLGSCSIVLDAFYFV